MAQVFVIEGHQDMECEKMDRAWWMSEKSWKNTNIYVSRIYQKYALLDWSGEYTPYLLFSLSEN